MTASGADKHGGSHSHTGLARLSSVSKARKPYTITKQRERWTDSEHDLFLEALKIHGRAWKSIQEHIGTKTTVQIRSHAQKFFSKLDKQSNTAKSEEAYNVSDRHRPRSKHASLVQPLARNLLATPAPPSAVDQTAVSKQQQTAADVAAAAGAVAAAAALQVIQAAGEQVQAQLQETPPQGFPFFGMTPTALSSLTQAELQSLSKAGSSSSATPSSLLQSAQLSVTNPAGLQMATPGSVNPGTDSVVPRLPAVDASAIPQALGSGDKLSTASGMLPTLAAATAAADRVAAQQKQAGPPSVQGRALKHLGSGKGSNELDTAVNRVMAAAHQEPVTESADTKSNSGQATTHSGTDGGVATSAGGVTGSGGSADAQSSQAQSADCTGNDSSNAFCNTQAGGGNQSMGECHTAEAAAAGKVPGSADAHLQQSHHGSEAIQAAAQLLAMQQANSYPPPVAHAPAVSPLYSQQMQQAMSVWGPYLAIYQMQAMMTGMAAPALYPPTPAGVPTMYPQQPGGPNIAEAHMLQAQQALVAAMQQSAAAGDLHAIPGTVPISPVALPQSLPHSFGIALANGSGPRQGTPPAATPPATSGLPIAGLVSTRSSSLPALQSTWLSSGSGANPFGAPVPPSSVNPSWLATPGQPSPAGVKPSST